MFYTSPGKLPIALHGYLLLYGVVLHWRNFKKSENVLLFDEVMISIFFINSGLQTNVFQAESDLNELKSLVDSPQGLLVSSHISVLFIDIP